MHVSVVFAGAMRFFVEAIHVSACTALTSDKKNDTWAKKRESCFTRKQQICVR